MESPLPHKIGRRCRRGERSARDTPTVRRPDGDDTDDDETVDTSSVGDNVQTPKKTFATIAMSSVLAKIHVSKKQKRSDSAASTNQTPRTETPTNMGGRNAMLATRRVLMAIKIQQSPFVKFRRVARAVKLLIQVCHVCKSLLESTVSQEAWFALVDNVAAATSLQQKKKGRGFMTFVPNEHRELVQLSFDVTEYMRHKRAEDYLTDDIRRIMQQRPGTRTDDQIVEVVRCLKGICKSFNEYPMGVQKQICQKAFFDQYRRNRVILRQGLAPDGVYFLLSGELVEKGEGRKQPVDIEAGEKFGEEELICGSSRRATVLSKHEVELLYLHRFDYRSIFNMSDDSYNPKNLEICKNDVVFQHFPMQKLLDNPGTWSNLKYKYGRLIVKDSNDIEWIYVIKSGEAKILKHLEPGTVDVKARRKKIQQMMEKQSPYHRKKIILDFVADGISRKSHYTPGNYHPAPSRPVTSVSRTRTAPQRTAAADIKFRSVSAVPAHVKQRMRRERPKTTHPTSKRQIDIVVDSVTGSEDDNHRTLKLADADNKSVMSHSDISSPRSDSDIDNKQPVEEDNDVRDEHESWRDSTSTMKETVVNKRRSRTEGRARSDNTKKVKNTKVDDERFDLPAFVQIETLHPGRTFGLRSCLEVEERGPSVSLVSGECEVLAINKKFFMKHCDDALYSLIRLKAKPFPTQTELVDRLDANMQWEEYKQETLKEFLRLRVQTTR